MGKFAIGDKVVPISKTAEGWWDLDEDLMWELAQRDKQPFLYVSDEQNEEDNYTCTNAESCIATRDGNFYTEEDLIPYIEPEGLMDLTQNDPVNPNHYKQGKVECIDAIESATTSLIGKEAVCTGQVIKYIWRWKMKNGLEDLRKVAWYLDRLIKHVEKSL